MAVRLFNGTSDDLVQNLGGATGLNYGAAAMLCQFSTTSGFRALFHFNNSSYSFVCAPISMTNFGTVETNWSGGVDTGFSPSTGVWYLIVLRKATGTTNPRYSIYNYNTATWTHGNTTGTSGDATAAGANGRSGFAFQGSSDFFGGLVAMRAAWSNNVPWTPDSSGDAALVAAGLHTSAANWLATNPSVCWKYDQATVSTVPDISAGGTGVQISVNGTSVVTGSDPPGFDFSLGGGGESTRAYFPLFLRGALGVPPFMSGRLLPTGDAPAATGPTIVTVNPATETDTAQPFARTKARAAGVAAESDTAVPVARTKARAAQPATEADTAQPVGRVKRRTVGAAAETDTAQPITRKLAGGGPIGPALETDTAQPVGRVKRRTVLPATELDTAVTLLAISRRAIGPAAETDTATAFTRRHTRVLGIASEVDEAVTLVAVGGAPQNPERYVFAAALERGAFRAAVEGDRWDTRVEPGPFRTEVEP